MAEHSALGRAGWITALLTAIIATLTVRALRGGPIRALDTDGHWMGGEPWPPLPAHASEPDVIDLTDAARTKPPTDPAGDNALPIEVASISAESAPASTPGPSLAVPNADAAPWVEAVDGECPDGYPVKANLRSGIFHQPGGLSYARTSADRCYRDAETARRDGLRAAKR